MMTDQEANDIVNRYGAVMERYASEIQWGLPESYLPAPKDDLRLALQRAWLMTADPNMKNSLEAGMLDLASFDARFTTPLVFNYTSSSTTTNHSGEMARRLDILRPAQQLELEAIRRMKQSMEEALETRNRRFAGPGASPSEPGFTAGVAILFANYLAAVGTIACFYLHIPLGFTFCAVAVTVFAVMSMTTIPFVELVAIAICKGLGLDWLTAIGLGIAFVEAIGMFPSVLIMLGALVGQSRPAT